MRSAILLVCAPLLLISAVACRNSSAAAIAETKTAAVKQTDSGYVGNVMGYSLDIPQSFVNWKGNNVLGGGGHQGYIKPITGTLTFDAMGSIDGGYFELDMNTITTTDKNDTSADNGLISHLKDPDFFDVRKYPRGAFKLIKAVNVSGDTSYLITGQLTLRSVTQEIHFPARIVRNGEDIVATASLSIDRTKWGITYKSGSVLGLMKEELLEDMIQVALALRFQQKRGC